MKAEISPENQWLEDEVSFPFLWEICEFSRGGGEGWGGISDIVILGMTEMLCLESFRPNRREYLLCKIHELGLFVHMLPMIVSPCRRDM